MNIFIFASNFWQDFLSNSLATLLGVVIGIPVALIIDRFVTKNKDKKEISKQREELRLRKRQLLNLFRDSLQKNLSLVEQMEKELTPNIVIFYNVDTQLLESTSSIKYENIDDLNLNQQLDSIRYELIHLHRKIDLQLDIEYSAYRAFGNYLESRTKIIEVITAHIPKVKQEILDALFNINLQLKDPEDPKKTI
jgi:uncharacterized membrane-anchored protein YhcB (DUF1043 family)